MISGSVKLLSNNGFLALEDIAQKKLTFKTLANQGTERVEVPIIVEKTTAQTHSVRQIVTDNISFWATLDQVFLTERGPVKTEDLVRGDVFVNDLMVWGISRDPATPLKFSHITPQIQFVNRAAPGSAPVNMAKIYCLKPVEYLMTASGIWFKPTS